MNIDSIVIGFHLSSYCVEVDHKAKRHKLPHFFFSFLYHFITNLQNFPLNMKYYMLTNHFFFTALNIKNKKHYFKILYKLGIRFETNEKKKL